MRVFKPVVEGGSQLVRGTSIEVCDTSMVEERWSPAAARESYRLPEHSTSKWRQMELNYSGFPPRGEA